MSRRLGDLFWFSVRRYSCGWGFFEMLLASTDGQRRNKNRKQRNTPDNTENMKINRISNALDRPESGQENKAEYAKFNQPSRW